jgi:nucleoside-diphosphate-sugar epimerase
MYYFHTNAEGNAQLTRVHAAQGCKKLVLASTSSLYAGQKMPFTEDLAVN